MTEEYLNKALLLKQKVKESETLLKTIEEMKDSTDLKIYYNDKNGSYKSFMLATFNNRMLQYIRRVCKAELENLKEQFNKY